ncbi:hypothetical protein ATCC90586_002586 [Pythium insidiosum]|nr:hypothetical protein ATCC90586_002586 [Pythium insidiosum]
MFVDSDLTIEVPSQLKRMSIHRTNLKDISLRVVPAHEQLILDHVYLNGTEFPTLPKMFYERQYHRSLRIRDLVFKNGSSIMRLNSTQYAMAKYNVENSPLPDFPSNVTFVGSFEANERPKTSLVLKRMRAIFAKANGEDSDAFDE